MDTATVGFKLTFMAQGTRSVHSERVYALSDVFQIFSLFTIYKLLFKYMKYNIKNEKWFKTIIPQE